MFYKNRCYNGGNQHKFEPRYTYIERDKDVNFEAKWIHPDDILKFITLKTYVHGVCVWCGKTVKEQDHDGKASDN